MRATGNVVRKARLTGQTRQAARCIVEGHDVVEPDDRENLVPAIVRLRPGVARIRRDGNQVGRIPFCVQADRTNFGRAIERPVDEIGMAVDALRQLRHGPVAVDRRCGKFAGREEVPDAARLRGDCKLVVQPVQRQQNRVGRAILDRGVDADPLAILTIDDLVEILRDVDVGQTQLRKIGAIIAVGGKLVHLRLAPLIRHRDQGAEPPVIRPGADQSECIAGELVRQFLVIRLARQDDLRALDIERARGLDVDRRADAAILQRGVAALVDVRAGNQFGGEQIEAERPARIFGRDRAPVDQHGVERRAEAAHRHELAFPTRPVDRHAGDALERFGDVRIGKLAEILGRDGIDDEIGIALHIDRTRQAGADPGDDDLVGIADGRIPGLRLGRTRHGGLSICRRGQRDARKPGQKRPAKQLHAMAMPELFSDCLHLNPPQLSLTPARRSSPKRSAQFILSEL